MTIEAQPVLEKPAVHGEGALWHAPTQVLYWVDINDKKVCVFDPATGRDTRVDVGSHCGTVVSRRSGGVVVAVQDGFAAVELKSGKVTRLATVPENGTAIRFNDGKCDPAGRLWAGTMPYDGKPGAAALYRLDPDLSVRRVFGNVTCSNGIVWTADRRTMYYIDTPTHEVWAFDYDDRTGDTTNRRTAFAIPAEIGSPDGMAIDADDRPWVALWGGGRVCQFDPTTGEVLATVHTPGAKLSSSCAFGGANLDELYITTSTEGLDQRARAAQPNAGRLFKARVNVRGVPASEFAG
jgi:sugar lactone lactonase YvrE